MSARRDPSRNPVAAGLCAGCGLAYAAAGAAFFADPSTAFAPGTPAYWASLAAAPVTRQAFLLAFALAGLLAACAVGVVAKLLGGRGAAALAADLGRVGFGVTAVSYFRLLGGEAQRAAAYAAGSEDARRAIASFSLSLDPGGYLIFGASGLCLALLGASARGAPGLPRALGPLGMAAGALYLVAFAARLAVVPALIDVAAGLGGIVIGPLWWWSLARLFLAGGRQPGSAR